MIHIAASEILILIILLLLFKIVPFADGFLKSS